MYGSVPPNTKASGRGGPPQAPQIYTAVGLSGEMDAAGVALWLQSNEIDHTKFEGIDGAKLFAMGPSKLKKLIGVKEGLKLHARLSQYRAMETAYKGAGSRGGGAAANWQASHGKPVSHAPLVVPAPVAPTMHVAPDVDSPCGICKGEVPQGHSFDLEGVRYHPECFLCLTCSCPLNHEILKVGARFYHVPCLSCHYCVKPLGGLKFCQDPDDGQTYCLEHMNKSQRDGKPYCPGCAKSVNDGQLIKAEGRLWHKACFNCCKCASPIDDFRTRAGGQPNAKNIFCMPCYKALFASLGGGVTGGKGQSPDERCSKCKGVFVDKREWMTIKTKAKKKLYFHPHCWSCSYNNKKRGPCTEPLDKAFFMFEDVPYCEDHIDIVDPQDSD